MDLKQLNYFVRVAELGSFTRASVALGIAQPALSRQIRLLEVELHQNLLTRNGRGALPTEAGNLLLKHGRGILHQVELAREELGSVRGALTGRVSIGLPPSLSRLITVPLSQAFKRRMPQANLTLTEGFSVLMLEGLRVGNLDVAVVYNAEPSPDVELTPLHTDQLVLISKQINGKKSEVERRPINLAAIAKLPLILPSRPNAFRILIERELRALGLVPRIALEVDGLNAILNLVKDGMGHAILPSYALSNVGDSVPFSVRSIAQPGITSQLMLARAARRPSTATQKIAADLINSVLHAAVPLTARATKQVNKRGKISA